MTRSTACAVHRRAVGRRFVAWPCVAGAARRAVRRATPARRRRRTRSAPGADPLAPLRLARGLLARHRQPARVSRALDAAARRPAARREPDGDGRQDAGLRIPADRAARRTASTTSPCRRRQGGRVPVRRQDRRHDGRPQRRDLHVRESGARVPAADRLSPRDRRAGSTRRSRARSTAPTGRSSIRCAGSTARRASSSTSSMRMTARIASRARELREDARRRQGRRAAALFARQRVPEGGRSRARGGASRARRGARSPRTPPRGSSTARRSPRPAATPRRSPRIAQGIDVARRAGDKQAEKEMTRVRAAHRARDTDAAFDSRRSGAGELAAPARRDWRAHRRVVAGMVVVALDPVPADLVLRGERVELAPQLRVLDGLPVARLPAVASSSRGSRSRCRSSRTANRCRASTSQRALQRSRARG